MGVEVPPSGTRGRAMPVPGSLVRLFNTVVFRLFRNRRVLGAKVLRLKTVGARSGQSRQATLLYFPDGDNWIVVASYGGTARHPAWYINLARHPDQVWAEVGKRTVRVTPELLQGDDRARVWRQIVAIAPMYADYQRHTDREIPVVRLVPTGATAQVN
jgi:deazaflavin-dependent oxidoreductase (nitroreductase family)